MIIYCHLVGCCKRLRFNLIETIILALGCFVLKALQHPARVHHLCSEGLALVYSGLKSFEAFIARKCYSLKQVHQHGRLGTEILPLLHQRCE